MGTQRKARSYEELKKLIYVSPERAWSPRLDPADLRGKLIYVTWLGDEVLDEAYLPDCPPPDGFVWKRAHLKFKWNPLTNMPPESSFPNERAYNIGYKRRADEAINQFTDEEIFIACAKGYGNYEYERGSSFNKVDRDYPDFIRRDGVKKLEARIEVVVYCAFKDKKKEEERKRHEYYRKLEQRKRNQNEGCYITTAICMQENKPDNCYELESFRKFRDLWLLKQEDGRELIESYYDTAPEIVYRINCLANSAEVYSMLREKYLKPCLSYIELGEYEKCKELYCIMVRTLQNQYLK